MSVDREALKEAIRAAMAELDREKTSETSEKASENFSQKTSESFAGKASDPESCDCNTCKPRHRPRVPIFDAKDLEGVRSSTPARLVQGRTGTRYLTEAYVGLRAEHATAIDAVQSEVPESLPAALGCISLQSKCKTREEFLLMPDLGRRLNDESAARLEKEATRGVDVQIICGDGLSAWALEENGPRLVPALKAAITSQGLTVGTPIFVKFARVGVQDDIGARTQAKATVILVGERPGLGTGDSLSIYSAYGPRLGQDNAEKDCISNIRPLGLPPEDAARQCADLLKRSFAAGGGGLKLVRENR
jgi:ethanolamine ammonia-lyase small subunit